MAWVLLLTLALVWAGSFFVTEIALQAYDPLFIVFCRVGIAFLCLAIVILVRRLPIPRSAEFWKTAIFLGILNNVIPFVTIVMGQVTITSGVASIFNATTPLFTLLVAHFVAKSERITPFSALGIGLGIAGVAVMIFPKIGLSGFAASSVTGQLLVLCAAISYGFAFIFSRRMSGYPVLLTAAAMLMVSTIVMTPIMLLTTDLKALEFVTGPAISLVLFGTVCTAFAYMIYFRLVNTEGATFTSLVTLLIPALAVGLGVVFLDEPFGWLAFCGMVLILSGLAVVQLSRLKKG